MASPPPDLRLYLVADLVPGDDRRLEQIRAAVLAGVTLVQLRCKGCSTAQVAAAATVLCQMLTPLGVGLIVNDDVEAALLAGAAGVHLGQADMPVGLARARLGPKALVGLSIEELSQVERAELAQVDYLAASPVYATTTKPDVAAPLGLEGVRELRARCEAPLVGIGGITEANAAAVIEAGADGVAVVSAILNAADSGTAARRLRQVVDTAFSARGRAL